MTKLLTFDNFIKGIGLVIAVCGLYYALDKRLSLMEQKLDYVVETYKEKESEAKLVLAELKLSDKEIGKELILLKERLLKITAILPNKIKLEDDNDQ
jgi:hypothetical protein